MNISGVNNCNINNNRTYKNYGSNNFLRQSFSHPILKSDTVSFKKQYSPKERGMNDVSVIELMAHNYLDLRRKDWGASIVYEGLTPHNISAKLKENFLDVMSKVGLGVQADANLVEWKTFLNADYKRTSCKGVNKARSDRLRDYASVGDFAVKSEYLPEDVALCIEKLKNNQAYQFLAMLVAFNDVKDSNRHIPLPFNIEVLAKTFAHVDASRENMSIGKLSRLYHSNLIDNALIHNPEKIIFVDNQCPVHELKECWVCVPGRGEEDAVQDKFINLVEIFSNKNWCTHSREDKAKAQVETGDFFVYLKRDDDNNWVPMTAVSSDNRYKKKQSIGVIELQGVRNNYILTDEDYKRIKILMRKFDKTLKFKHRDINDNAPTACVQMSIMNYLEKGSPLARAISDIRNANEQIDNMKAKRTKSHERIKALKPTANSSIEPLERINIENEIKELNEQVKATEQVIINTNEKNKELYKNLLLEMGATPTSVDYSVIDTIEVLNKVLDLPTLKAVRTIETISETDIPLPEPQTIPAVSTTVSIPVAALEKDFNRKLFLDKVIQKISKLDLNGFTTSENLLSLQTYNPLIDLDYENGQKRPYSQVPLMYFGIDEDILLSDVKSIDVFYMKNSGIKKFPKNLSNVNELHCSDVQYRKFKNEINLLKARNPQMKLFISVAK